MRVLKSRIRHALRTEELAFTGQRLTQLAIRFGIHDAGRNDQANYAARLAFVHRGIEEVSIRRFKARLVILDQSAAQAERHVAQHAVKLARVLSREPFKAGIGYLMAITVQRCCNVGRYLIPLDANNLGVSRGRVQEYAGTA